MALKFSTPNQGEPFLNSDGPVSTPGFLFLSAVLQTVGGPSVVGGGGIEPITIQQQFEEYAVSSPEALDAQRGVDELRNADRPQDAQIAPLMAAVDELRNELAYAKNEVQALRGVVDDLLSATAALTVVDQFRNRIADLEDRLG